MKVLKISPVSAVTPAQLIPRVRIHATRVSRAPSPAVIACTKPIAKAEPADSAP